MQRRQFLSAMSLAAVGCAKPREAAPIREVSVALSEHLTVSAMYLADEKGYLRDAGFKMNPLGVSGIQAVPLLAGGRLDVILGGAPSPLINGVLRGMPIRLVAGREYVSPACGDGYTLYAHKAAFAGGPIDPKRLKGKRFSIRSRGITEFMLDAFLEAQGMSGEDIECVDLPLREALAALAGNKIDALFDPELSRSPLAISPDIVKVWRYVDAQPFHQYSFVIFGESMLKAGREVGARFLAAYLTAAGDFLDGETPHFMRDFASRHGLDVDRTIAECRETFPRDGAVDVASVQRIVDWNVAKGYVAAPLEAAQLIDTSYLDEAHRLIESDAWRVRHPADPST